jgi:hypothetical protein
MASAQPFPIPPKVSSSRQTSISKSRRYGSRTVSHKTIQSPLKFNSMTNQTIARKGTSQPTLQQVKTSVPQGKNDSSGSSKVKHLPSSQRPFWLQALISVHFISSGITFILISAALGVYGWTVYTQQSWGRAYHNLETLQRYERQLVTTNESIKNDLAQQAEEPAMGLVNPDPNTTIFLTPSSTKLNPSPSAIEPESSLSESETSDSIPLGY